jgi:hypothetical protein
VTDFSFTATAACSACGKYLSSSDEDCDNCADYEQRRYHFVHLHDDHTVQTVWAITHVRAWYELGRRVDDVLPWRLHETGQMSLDYAQAGTDVTDEDDLRQQQLPK